jgi:hypothetical protein
MYKNSTIALLSSFTLLCANTALGAENISFSSGKTGGLSVPADDAPAELTDEERAKRFNIFYQTTFIGHSKPGMSELYSGPNSLQARYETG